MSARGSAGGRAPGASVALALLALVIQALVPAGYMVAAGSNAPVVVICTGHGPLRLADHGDRHAPLQKKTAGVCAFAGHGAPPLPEAARPLSAIRWSEAAPAVAVRPSVFIGRGLAAPPPARAPPARLV